MKIYKELQAPFLPAISQPPQTHRFGEDVANVVDLEEGGLCLVAGLVHVVHGAVVRGLGPRHQQRLHQQAALQLRGEVGPPASASAKKVKMAGHSSVGKKARLNDFMYLLYQIARLLDAHPHFCTKANIAVLL